MMACADMCVCPNSMGSNYFGILAGSMTRTLQEVQSEKSEQQWEV